MFRGSSYSIETEKDCSFQHLSEERVKLSLVGVGEVGKSSILNCMERERFNEDIPPTNGFHLRFKKIKINHHLLVNLTIWDGNGDRMLQYIQEGSLSNFDGLMFVYDLGNPHSVIQLEQLYQEVQNKQDGEFVGILVGNKADLVDQQRPNANEAYYLATKFAQRYGLIHQNVSAKLNSCVTDCFVLTIKQILSLRRHIRTSRLEDEEDYTVAPQGTTECSLCQNCHLDKCQLI